MDRRSFLLGAGTLVLSQLASGCNSGNQASLTVRLLKGSIPAQLLSAFRKDLKQSAALNFAPEEQLKQLFTALQVWKQQASTDGKEKGSWLPLPLIGRKTPEAPDLVTLGDYWLETAIQQKLIQPLNIKNLAGWQSLPERWQALVKRNEQGVLDASGAVWGAPYRWGSTVIAYRRDKFKSLGWTPKDWSDLWRPELRDRISLLDQPREVIGLTLKKLGHSYNTTQLSQVQNLKQELLALHQQVKFYSSDNYLQPLILGDTWVAVGWSTDVLPLLQRDRKINAVIPLSGTALWADLWVRPASAKPSQEDTEALPPLTAQWIDYCWQPQPARNLSLLSRAASPIFTNLDQAKLPKELQNTPLLLPDTAIFNKSDFLNPLPKWAVEQYQDWWKEIRALNASSSS